VTDAVPSAIAAAAPESASAALQLSLRPLTLGELADLAATRIPAGMAGRAQPGALPPAFVAQRALDRIAQGGSEFWCATFLIVREDGEVIGGCGFKREPADGRVEIAYGIAPAHRRQGAAVRAVRAMLDLAFASGVREVCAEVLPDNTASIGVVRKLGFQFGGTRIDADGDTVGMWVVCF
jgi:RimJ/RimL family protein N-acetyltransferase